MLELLPYSKPFLFVDEILSIDEDGCEGIYTYPIDSYFYAGHFKNEPVTPGVILIETMAQIGVVCLGLHLLREEIDKGERPRIALSSTSVDFYLPVLPGERVTVRSRKEYFRFNKLKCRVEMRTTSDDLVCRGTISGMIGREKH